jgi:hypothetical protein
VLVQGGWWLRGVQHDAAAALLAHPRAVSAHHRPLLLAQR